MSMIIFLGIVFLTGILTKLVDLIEDDGYKLFKFANIILGFIYGLLIGFTIIYFEFIAALWIAVVLSVILSIKIDKPGHVFGIIGILIILFIYGFPEFSYILFAIFLIASIFEEIFNSLIVDKGIIKNKILFEFFRLRPILEIVVFVVSLTIGNIFIWLGLLFFDIGYNLTARLR